MTVHNIPSELTTVPNWVVWKYETRDGKDTKVPYNAHDGSNAKVNDSKTWASFEIANHQADPFTASYDGVGFMLHGTELVGIDFDGVIHYGKIEPFVLDILKHLGNPYAEITPSGEGVRAFVYADLPKGKRRFTRGKPEKYGAEIYSGKEGGRYLTVTGHRIQGSGSTIPKLDNIAAAYFMVSQILNEKLKSLWMGDLSEYDGDQSRADMALLGILRDLTDGDRKQMESLFSLSRLGARSKWTERKDYRDRSIDAVLKPTKAQRVPAVIAEAFDDEPEIIIEEEPLPPFPELTGSLAELSRALAPDLPYCHKFMVGVTLLGAILSGHVNIQDSPHVEPRFYTIMVDDKGAGKGGSKNEMYRALEPLVTGELNTIHSINSGPALVLELAQHPRTMLYADELDKLFEVAKTGGKSGNSLFGELLTLYDGHETGNNAKSNLQLPNKIQQAVCKSGDSKIVVKGAQLSILGGTQPDVFQQMWRGSKSSSNGLQSRFMLVSSGNKFVPEPQRPSDMQEVDRLTGLVTEQVLPYLNADEPLTIHLPNDLGDRQRSWWPAVQTQYPKASARTPAMVTRILIILAVTNGVQTITPELMEQALAWGEYEAQLAERFMPSDSLTWTQAFEDLIIGAFRKHGKLGLSQNQVRRYVNPEKHKLLGGHGPYMTAWKNLVNVGVLAIDRTNNRSFAIYRLAV